MRQPLRPLAAGGAWGHIIDALAAAHDAAVQMIDTSIVRCPQSLQPHQSLDPMQTAFDAFCQKIMPDPACTVGPVAGNEACLDLHSGI